MLAKLRKAWYSNENRSIDAVLYAEYCTTQDLGIKIKLWSFGPLFFFSISRYWVVQYSSIVHLLSAYFSNSLGTGAPNPTAREFI